MSAPAIDLSDLEAVFPGRRRRPVRALRGVNLRVAPGTVHGFLGPNGAGKSTTMLVLLNFVPPAAGRARIFGVDTRETLARERIGYLPELPQLYPFLTAREMLVFTGRMFRLPRRRAAERAAEWLDRLDLAAAADRRLAGFSRGMLQRVGLARALMNDPDLLILDEPTGGMDPLGRKKIRELIADMRRAGKTVFFSSHELSEIELVCDDITLLVGGRVAASGPTSKLVPAGENLERFFLERVAAAAREDRA